MPSQAQGGAVGREGAAGSTIYPSSSLCLPSCRMRCENELSKFRAKWVWGQVGVGVKV